MDRVLGFHATKWGLAVCLALAALGAYLFVTHTGHYVSALPYPRMSIDAFLWARASPHPLLGDWAEHRCLSS